MLLCCGDRMQHARWSAMLAVVIQSPDLFAKEWPLVELQCFIDRQKHAACNPDPFVQVTILPLFYRFSADKCYNTNAVTTDPTFSEAFDRHKSSSTLKSIFQPLLQYLPTQVGVRNHFTFSTGQFVQHAFEKTRDAYTR